MIANPSLADRSAAASTDQDSQPGRPAVAPVKRGRAHPLGAVADAGGVNFSIFSEDATVVTLLIFDPHDAPQPIQVIPLDPLRHKTFHFWHAYVDGLRPGAHYAYRIDGPTDLHGQGQRFNPNLVLIDPYARGNTTTRWDRAAATRPDDNVATAMRSVVVDTSTYDWEGDRPLNRSISKTIIYELHVGGFTKSPTSGVHHPGTFAGLVEKIPYLQSLGITAVELLPVCQFDEQELRRLGPDGTLLTNYWGYSPVGFFAPHAAYCVTANSAGHIREFRDMVKALHRAGIEVILDMVFNHTSEGNHQGPTISFRGLANNIYYHLVAEDRQFYRDYSGCGNTFNCNHPIAEKLILDCLEFWVEQMHVDGFRFDEGSVLARGEDGTPLEHPPVLWHIELSEKLADTKVIAEAWDAGGLYQVGNFPGYRWVEWNGRYRDDIRRFVRGDRGLVGPVAARIAGSADLYQTTDHRPINSVNFLTCHDGFTLYDLVSYNVKHNEANGEENRDGLEENFSWNCGVEGETADPAVSRLRRRQVRNFLAILLLSQGVPMITAGDEVGRTQRGNNNAYCQNNELSWFDWTLVERNADILRFCQQMIAFRKRHPLLESSHFVSGEVNALGLADIAWHGCRLDGPGWDNPAAGVLAFTRGGSGDAPDLHVMLNVEESTLAFDLPGAGTKGWFMAVNTALAPPLDIAEPGAETPVAGDVCQVEGRSVVVLVSKPPATS